MNDITNFHKNVKSGLGDPPTRHFRKFFPLKSDKSLKIDYAFTQICLFADPTPPQFNIFVKFCIWTPSLRVEGGDN